MKILIEGSSIIRKRTGVGEFGRNLTAAMVRQAPLDKFVLFGSAFFMRRFEKPLSAENLSYKFERFIPARVNNWLATIGLGLPVDLLARFKPDVTLFPDFIRRPLLFSTKSVTVIHDLVFAIHPEFIENKRFGRQLHQQTQRAVKKSSRLVAVSENTKRDLVKTFGADPRQVVIINNAVDHKVYQPANGQQIKVVKRRYGITKDYLLYLGTLEPRKNITGIIQAYLRLSSEQRLKHQLVLAGGMGWQNEEWQPLAEQHPSEIILTGYVADSDKTALYSGASVFVYPSHYEGWGMQILEAMACGTPVITTRNSSLVEAGGEAALYIGKSTDVAALTVALEKVLKNSKLRQAMRAKGLKHASQFTWEKSAQKMLDLLHEVAEQ